MKNQSGDNLFQQFKNVLNNSEFYDISKCMSQNCVGCINFVKGICVPFKEVPEHRCFKYKKKEVE